MPDERLMTEEEILAGCLKCIGNEISAWMWKRQQYERQGDTEFLEDANNQLAFLQQLYKETDWWEKTGHIRSVSPTLPDQDAESR